MGLLALDIGTKKTGVAFGEMKSGIVVALDTIRHSSIDDLVHAVQIIIQARRIKQLVIGLPRLLDGHEGSQADFVRTTAEQLRHQTGLPIEFIDERYTNSGPDRADDAGAACAILSVFLDQKNRY
jgi:putative Holliday junction resolvase